MYAQRRDPILTFALCASLVAHTAVLLILAGQFVDSLPPLSLGALRSNQPSAARVAIVQSRPPPPAPPSYLLFGDSKGTGDAANSSLGAQPMQGREGGQTQAFLSRDPIGPGKVGDEPSMSVLPQGVPRPSPESSEPPIPPSPPPTLTAIGITDGVQAWSAPRPSRPARPAAPQAPEAPPAPPAPPDTPIGAPTPPADAAAMSDSESDAFARGNSVEFLDGRVEARFGRKVKTVRPRLSLAAKYDLLGMEFPRMIVRVTVDNAGNVRLVDIVKSSGSDSADQAVKVAMYQWWFEPPKDKKGSPVADVVEFPIVWR